MLKMYSMYQKGNRLSVNHGMRVIFQFSPKLVLVEQMKGQIPP